MKAFEEKKVQELFETEKKGKVLEYFDDKNSGAHITRLDNGQFILIPA